MLSGEILLGWGDFPRPSKSPAFETAPRLENAATTFQHQPSPSGAKINHDPLEISAN